MTARRLLLLLVFVSGLVSLGVELSASRLLSPYFGDSLYVWGILISLVLIYLSVGYVIGGRLSDRRPRADVIFRLVAVAGTWTGLVPLFSYPLLILSQRGFSQLSAGLVVGTLVAVVLLFALPVVILGMVSPFAIRLLLEGVATGGNTAGAVFALSTAGSIVGTVVPVFWLIPTFGTRFTLLVLSLLLLVVSVLGLWSHKRRRYAALLLIVLGAHALLPSGIKAPVAGRLLYETESAYNYIQVIRVGGQTELFLNEGRAVHSIYDPARLVTGGPWDYFVLGSYFRPRQSVEPVPKNTLILGLAGGTTARQLTAAYGSGTSITGVEIDPAIAAVGRRYFHMNESNLTTVVGDARYFLANDRHRYDVIDLDAYQQPYVPFYLTTTEFFQLALSHLNPGGAVVVNAGRTATDYRLVQALASTMAAVYPSVFLVDVPDYTNTMIFASARPTTVAAVTHNLHLAREPLVQQIALSALGEGRLRASEYHQKPYTDDLAPIEQVVDQIILEVAAGG